MRTISLSLLLSLIFIVAVAWTDDDESPRNGGQRESGNAALAYWQAQECLLALIPDISDPSAAVPRFKIISDGHKAPLNEDAIEAIRRSAMALYFLRRGARFDKCDWGLAFDELGPADEQGHLASMPLLVGAACLRARYYFEHDMSQDAIADLIAVLRLARHAGNRGHDGARALISQLSTETRAIDIAARWLPEMDAADAQRLGSQVTEVPIPEILKNLFAAQKRQWVHWPTEFAQHARNHHGDWDSYWVKVGMRADYRDEVGNLLRDASNGDPDRLLSLANDAAGIFEQGRSLAVLPLEEFRPAWRALLKKSADQNLIVELAGGEVEPLLDGLVLAEERRALFRAGVLVARNGPEILKDIEVPSGPFEYRKLKDGFELISKRKSRGEPLKLVFGQPGDGPGGS